MLHLRTVRVERFFLATYTFSMSLTQNFTFIWRLQKKSTKLTFYMASVVMQNSYKCATCSFLFCNFNCHYLNNMETDKLRFTYKNNVAYIWTFWLHQFKSGKYIIHIQIHCFQINHFEGNITILSYSLGWELFLE